MSSLTDLLLQAQNPSTQKQAEEALKHAEQTNLAEYLVALSVELSDPSKNPLALRLAGLILKNAFFDSRNEAATERKRQAWKALDETQVRAVVKGRVLLALVSNVKEAREGAAQVVGTLGELELSQNGWEQLVPQLLQNSTSPQLGDDVKVQTLQAIGYLCENLGEDALSETVTNNLLNAIMASLQPAKSEALRIAAIKALLNTLAFAKANMGRANERNVIVKMICESAQTDNVEIRICAFDCMTMLVELYYSFLGSDYMEAFYKLTFNAVKVDEEKVAMHAIEFWSALCEVESSLHVEAEDSEEVLAPEKSSKDFIRAVLAPLVELVTASCLKRQAAELADDDDEWNIAMAAATLLGLIATCVKDDILPVVMPFISANLPLAGEANWRSREAGLMAFGKILDGPSPEKLQTWIQEGVKLVLPLLDAKVEPKPHVRDTAAWALGVVCELHLESIAQFLHVVVEAIVRGLDDPAAHVACKNALAIQLFANNLVESQDAHKNTLSKYIVVVMQSLLRASERVDWNESDLRGQCFDSLNAVIESSAMDSIPCIMELMTAVMQKLQMAVSAKVDSAELKEEVEGMITFCCGTLLVIVQKVGRRIEERAGPLMQLVLHVLQTHNGSALQDAYMLVGSIALALQGGFLIYFNAVVPHLVRGLKHSDDYQICLTAAGLVSDFSYALGAQIAPVAQELVLLLCNNLANQELHRDVKPPTITALGDMAMALNDGFYPFADHTLKILEGASVAAMTTQPDDQETVDFVNKLEESILNAYTGISNGLSRNPQLVHQAFIEASHLDPVLNFIVDIARRVANEENYLSDAVVGAAVGLLLDLVQNIGQDAKYKIKSAHAYFNVLIDYCGNCENEDLKAIAQLAVNALR